MPTVYSAAGTAVELSKILSDTGGQSDVYYLGNTEAVKLFRTPTDGDRQKLCRLMTLGAYRALESVATIPTGLLYESRKLLRFNEANGLVGFRMSLAKDYIPIEKILFIHDQAQLGLSMRDMVSVFIDLHAVLNAIHKARFVVGDLHANNIMVNLKAGAGKRVVIIDVDSWGYCSEDGKEYFPVTALAEQVEHPRLQVNAKNLPQEKHRVNFDRDWFAFALHLTTALTGLSPYETGVVPNTGVDERKRRGLTIMSRHVRLSAESLPAYQRMGKYAEDVLRSWLTVSAVGEFPLHILTEHLLPNIVKCHACGFETLASYWCPKCAMVR